MQLAKSTTLIAIYFIFTSISTHTWQQDELSIYSRAVTDLINYKRVKGFNSIIYLEASESIQADLIRDKMESDDLILITNKNQKSLYKNNNNSLTHSVIFPAQVEGGKIKITITPYQGIRKGRNYILKVSDGYTIIYKVDATTSNFVLEEVTEWGI